MIAFACTLCVSDVTGRTHWRNEMSLAKEIVSRQLDVSGTLLLRASSTLSNDEFFYEGPGGSMAWTLNHLSALQDWAVNRVFLKGKPKLNSETREAFKGGRAVTSDDRKKLGSKSEIESFFAEEQYQTIQTLGKFDEASWNTSTPSGCRFPTLGTLWEHLATHNHWHLGAISASLPRITPILLVAPRFYTVDPEGG